MTSMFSRNKQGRKMSVGNEDNKSRINQDKEREKAVADAEKKQANSNLEEVEKFYKSNPVLNQVTDPTKLGMLLLFFFYLL